MSTKKYSPADLMQLAIDESQNSIPEHHDKTDPLVGAIIATADGQILAKAHRGELREGEHCEYTLIERKLVNDNLKGCVLYVTLEPCTDESRKRPKRGCSTHIGKARLSKVYIGVEDPNPKIAGNGIKALRDKGIEVEMFPSLMQETIWRLNSDFKKEKEIEALNLKHDDQEVALDLLESPVKNATIIRDLSEALINSFISETSAPYSYPSDTFNEWAYKFGLLNKVENSDIFQPTGLGILLFGNEPETSFPQSVFKVEISYGPGETEVRDFKGPLIGMVPELLEFIKGKGLKLTMDKSKGRRNEVADFPFEVLLEAIVNAVIHRDYSIEGSTNYLYIDPDRIIVRSPGEPPFPLTLQNLQNFDAPSISRNPKIMYIFNQMKLAEQRGIGIRNMRALPEKGFPSPTFELKAGILEITFGRTTKYLAEKSGLDDEESITGEEKVLFLFIQKKGSVSRRDVVDEFNMNEKTAQRRLANLVDKNLVKMVGDRKGARYSTIN